MHRIKTIINSNKVIRKSANIENAQRFTHGQFLTLTVGPLYLRRENWGGRKSEIERIKLKIHSKKKKVENCD